MKATRLVNGNVFPNGRRTSVKLEPEFWRALNDTASVKGISVRELATHIENQSPGVPLASAIRVWLLRYAQGWRD
jgi:predicted DNA-binding ribbon-helix-helix protein